MTLTDELSMRVGAAFAAEGMDPAFGAVRASDRPDLAQFQCNGALAAAKAAKANPREIGARVAGRLAGDATFAETSLAGPGFINLTLDDADLARRLAAAFANGEVGGWRAPRAERIVLDYGGPNVAKPLHVGHLRSAIIGEALKRVLRAVGHDVTSDVHLGDWGLQMGQLISEVALRHPDAAYFADIDGPFPDEPALALADLEEMYPAASAACKADPARAELARKATKALQEGRPGYRALWRRMVDLSIAAMKTDYADLGVSFDLWKGEADADALLPEIARDLDARGVIERSDGADIIRVARDDDDKTVPPVIFRNSEGAVGYHATDVATIVDRVRGLDPDRMLYVVDGRQRLHFEQVFRAGDRAGYFDEAKLEHLWFGTMNGPDGKPFKPRAGGVLKLRELIETAEAKARERLAESGFAASLPAAERDDVARKVAVAALKFADLSNPRTSDYVFDLDRFMAFEGKTGPYLLYASVRIRSVLEKAGADLSVDVLSSDVAAAIDGREARDLALALVSYADAARAAVDRRAPHLLCDHAFALAQAFSKFYAARRIADEADGAVRRGRIALAAAAGRQLDAVLDLLGVAPPARM
ncbi:MAG: arginine--tRNA ligase [Parvularculaceae bacterium]